MAKLVSRAECNKTLSIKFQNIVSVDVQQNVALRKIDKL